MNFFLKSTWHYSYDTWQSKDSRVMTHDKVQDNTLITHDKVEDNTVLAHDKVFLETTSGVLLCNWGC